MDVTFGLGAGGAVVAGAIIAGVGLYMPGIPKKAGKIIAALGLIVAFLGVAVFLGLLNQPATGQAVGEKAMYDITFTESNSYLSFDDDNNAMTFAASFNDTSDAFVDSTNTFTGVFTLTRTDALITDAVALGSLTSVALVDVTGDSPEPIVAELADGSSNFLWTKASGATIYEDVSVLVESGDSSTVNITVTLNADAFANMAQYESQDIRFTLGGESFVIHCIKATVST